MVIHLKDKLLDLTADLLDLRAQLGSIVGEDTAGDDRSRDTASAAKSDLGGDKHIGDVLQKVRSEIRSK